MDVLHRFERGEGELVALLHGAASHSGQWRALVTRLAPTYRTIAWDQYGYRDSPAWSESRPLKLHDQVAPLFSYLHAQSGPIHLIGHSHGATLAALLARDGPESVCLEGVLVGAEDELDRVDERAVEVEQDGGERAIGPLQSIAARADGPVPGWSESGPGPESGPEIGGRGVRIQVGRERPERSRPPEP